MKKNSLQWKACYYGSFFLVSGLLHYYLCFYCDNFFINLKVVDDKKEQTLSKLYKGQNAELEITWDIVKLPAEKAYEYIKIFGEGLRTYEWKAEQAAEEGAKKTYISMANFGSLEPGKYNMSVEMKVGEVIKTKQLSFEIDKQLDKELLKKLNEIKKAENKAKEALKEVEKKQKEQEEEEKKKLEEEQKKIEEEKKKLEELKKKVEEELKKKLEEEKKKVEEEKKKIEEEKKKKEEEIKKFRLNIEELEKKILQEQKKNEELQKKREEEQKENEQKRREEIAKLRKDQEENQQKQQELMKQMMEQTQKQMQKQFQQQMQQQQQAQQQQLEELKQQAVQQAQQQKQIHTKELAKYQKLTQKQLEEIQKQNDMKLSQYKKEVDQQKLQNKKLQKEIIRRAQKNQADLKKQLADAQKHGEQLENEIIRKNQQLKKTRSREDEQKVREERWKLLSKVRASSEAHHEQLIQRFAQRFRKGQTIPLLSFFDSVFMQNLDQVMRYHNMELIAYPESQHYFVSVDLNKLAGHGKYERRTDFDFILQRSDLSIFVNEIFPDVNEEITSSRALYNRSEGNLNLAMIFPHKTANYLAWKSVEVCKRHGYDPEQVRECECGFKKTRNGYWSLIVKKLHLKGGKTVRVSDFEENW